jgi:hypothetical protein
MMSPPFEISRHSGLEELNEGVTNRVFYRAIFPIIIVLVGAVIPPVFGGWGYYVGGTILSVDKSDIAELSDTNSELILSVLPNIGGNIQFFNGVPSEEGKVLFVILSGLTVVSMWNLSYLSQIIFSPRIRVDTGNYIQNKFMKRVIDTVITIYFFFVLVEIL